MQSIQNGRARTHVRRTSLILGFAAIIVTSLISLNTRAATPVFSAGFTKWERWADQAGDTANIDAFAASLLDPAFRRADTNGVSTFLGSPRGVADNYGVRASGFFVPAVTGSYVFFMACDDQGYLYLSTNDSPANKKLIASQPQWSDALQWNDPDAASITEVRSDSFTLSEWTPPNTITLTAGNRYYVELVFREGGGGDGSELLVKLASDPDPANGAPATGGDFIGGLFDPTGATVTISQQPTNTVAQETSFATLTVSATGISTNSGTTLAYQWKRNGVSIPGANAASYTTPRLKLADTGATYSALVMVAGTSVLSSNATLTVNADSVRPTIATVFGSDKFTELTVGFSEPVTAATATNGANYQLSGGLTISAVTALVP